MRKTSRADRAAVNAALQAVVQFAGEANEAERSAIAQRLFLLLLNPLVTRHFGVQIFPDLKLTENSASPMPPFETLLETPIETLQGAVRPLLADVVAHRHFRDHASSDTGWWHVSGHKVSVTTTLSVTSYGPSSDPTNHLLCIGGAVRDVFLAAVCQLLARSPARKILQCPGCPNLFYKVGRQTHCSKACYDRYYWQSGYPAGKKRRARKKWYASKGWTLGARTKKQNTSKIRQ